MPIIKKIDETGSIERPIAFVKFSMQTLYSVMQTCDRLFYCIRQRHSVHTITGIITVKQQ